MVSRLPKCFIFSGGDRHGIGGDILFDRKSRQPLGGVARENGMDKRHINVVRTICLHQVNRLGDGPARVDLVIDEDHVAVRHITDDGEGFGIGVVGRAPLLDESDRRVDAGGEVASLSWQSPGPR